MTSIPNPDGKAQALRSPPELIEDIKALTLEIQQLYCQDELPWIVGYSGGKDSTAAFQLVWQAIAALPTQKRTKVIHVITTDTMVENPVVSAWVSKSLDLMKIAAQEQGMPVEPLLLKPAIKDTFWVNLIGKGYPAPRQAFRWCTERLKIKPSDNYIREKIRVSGEVILVLGTRKTESVSRAALMAKHRNWRVSPHLNYNPSRPNSLIYTPIEDWRTDEVWLYLMQWQNPWGNNNKELFRMYRGATADNECPLVIDTSTPSCGSSRFGCWVCTLVTRDKSMEAMIQNDEEKEWMQPLLDLRNELDVEDDLERRDFRRRSGNIQLYERNIDGSNAKEVVNIPGPYTKQWREEWLRRVLIAQAEARRNAPSHMQGIELIAQEELSEIRRIWLEEFHEFDDSLPLIYWEITGEIFQDPCSGAGNPLLGIDEWSLLEKICDGSTYPLIYRELVIKLLDTVRQYWMMSRRAGLYDALEKCFNSNAQPKEEALVNAHYAYDLKKAAKDGDVEAVKRITTTWAELKFKEQPKAKASSDSYHLPDKSSEVKNDRYGFETKKLLNHKPKSLNVIFRELVLQNFGSYCARQVIELNPNTGSSRGSIILFGGMNGGGKTTLMDAIRLALYGQRSCCSTRGKLSYSEFLTQSVNRCCSPEESACIELTFQQTVNNQLTNFRICRTWTRQPKNGRDTLEVYKDDVLDHALTKTWDERVEDLLPLGISNLFLFDGEQVKQLAEQDELPLLVKSAIRSLLGLELPDRLSTHLEVLVNRKRKDLATNQGHQKLEEIERRLSEQEQKCQPAKKKVASAWQKLEAAEEKAHQAYEKFLTEGGKIAAEQQQIEMLLQQKKDDAEAQRRVLRDLANGVLPLAMIQPLLKQAQDQVKSEVRSQQFQVAKKLLQERNQRLLDFVTKLNLSLEQIDQIQAFLAQEDERLVHSQSGSWLKADLDSLHDLTGVLEHGLPTQLTLTTKQLTTLEACQADIESTEGYLATASVPEIYEKLAQNVKQTKAKVAQLETIHKQAKQDYEQLLQEITRTKQNLVEYSELAIDGKNSEHILTASSKVQEILKVFKEQLKLRKLNQLETLVTECFLYLLHKSDLVHRIQIDTQTFSLFLFDYDGQPVPKHRLSAGEKQLLAIALLWGLARASGRQLPIAIDTPLGRLDSSHRDNLVERYFPQASHQVILLSTDTEIGKVEVERLREVGAIAYEYLCEYNPDERLTTVKPGYFW